MREAGKTWPGQCISALPGPLQVLGVLEASNEASLTLATLPLKDQELADEALLSAEAEVDSEDELAESEAAGADDSAGAEAAGGVASGAVSCVLLLQAASISAATRAPRTSLVFIDQYPEEKQEW